MSVNLTTSKVTCDKCGACVSLGKYQTKAEGLELRMSLGWYDGKGKDICPACNKKGGHYE